MTYVVTKPCIGTKDRSCVEVCPVDCFYDICDKAYNEKYGVAFASSDGDDEEKGSGLLMIHPDQCINCGACETECPVEAIYEDASVPDEYQEFVDINEKVTLAMSDDQLAETNCTSK